MRASISIRRAIYLIASVAPAWALVTAVTDGIAWRLGPLRISSTEPVRPLIVAAVAAAWYIWRSSESQRHGDGRWLTTSLRGIARLLVPVIAVSGLIIGVAYGTFAVAGSDAYGYVSQATLWLRGDLRIEQPIVQSVPWPDAAWTFTPLGYRPISSDGTIVPTYPPGLPLVMAVFLALFGSNGAFYVVPLTAALALYLTYVLGCETTGSRSVGALASLLLLASPPFLAHVIVPMSDVPATAAWTLVWICVLKDRDTCAGLAAAAALLVRPNLLLLTAVPILSWRSDVVRRTLAFAAGLVPAVIALAVFNTLLYGTPFETGYGAISDLYAFGVAPQNIRNYTGWLVETQTPMIALALIPLFVRGAIRPTDDATAPKALLIAIPALVCVSYIFYNPFDNWTYLRFLLPGYPALFVLFAAGIAVICSKVPQEARPAVSLLLAATAVMASVHFAQRVAVLDARVHEARYERGAAAVSELAPPQAVLFSSQHSGSLRYYTNRMTLRYDLLSPDQLDVAVRTLAQQGKPSYLVLDQWEQEDFRKRFREHSALGRLDWPPRVRVAGAPEVLIYELSSR